MGCRTRTVCDVCIRRIIIILRFASRTDENAQFSTISIKKETKKSRKKKKKKTATNKLIIECSNYACRTASRSLRSYYIVRLIELLSWQNCRFGVTLSSFSLSSPAFEFGLLLFSLVAFAGCYRIVIHTAVICLTPSIIFCGPKSDKLKWRKFCCLFTVHDTIENKIHCMTVNSNKKNVFSLCHRHTQSPATDVTCA